VAHTYLQNLHKTTEYYMFNGQYSGQPVPECQTILNFVAARGVVGGSRGEEQIKRCR